MTDKLYTQEEVDEMLAKAREEGEESVRDDPDWAYIGDGEWIREEDKYDCLDDEALSNMDYYHIDYIFDNYYTRAEVEEQIEEKGADRYWMTEKMIEHSFLDQEMVDACHDLWADQGEFVVECVSTLESYIRKGRTNIDESYYYSRLKEALDG